MSHRVSILMRRMIVKRGANQDRQNRSRQRFAGKDALLELRRNLCSVQLSARSLPCPEMMHQLLGMCAELAVASREIQDNRLRISIDNKDLQRIYSCSASVAASNLRLAN